MTGKWQSQSYTKEFHSINVQRESLQPFCTRVPQVVGKSRRKKIGHDEAEAIVRSLPSMFQIQTRFFQIIANVFAFSKFVRKRATLLKVLGLNPGKAGINFIANQ